MGLVFLGRRHAPPRGRHLSRAATAKAAPPPLLVPKERQRQADFSWFFNGALRRLWQQFLGQDRSSHGSQNRRLLHRFVRFARDPNCLLVGAAIGRKDLHFVCVKTARRKGDALNAHDL